MENISNPVILQHGVKCCFLKDRKELCVKNATGTESTFNTNT